MGGFGGGLDALGMMRRGIVPDQQLGHLRAALAQRLHEGDAVVLGMATPPPHPPGRWRGQCSGIHRHAVVEPGRDLRPHGSDAARLTGTKSWSHDYYVVHCRPLRTCRQPHARVRARCARAHCGDYRRYQTFGRVMRSASQRRSRKSQTSVPHQAFRLRHRRSCKNALHSSFRPHRAPAGYAGRRAG
jgi:hypothetical protein